MTLMNDAIITANDGWDGPGAWWPIFPALWLIVIAGIVTTVVLVGRRNRRMVGRRAGEARLAELFASGEITDDEYRHRLTVLREDQT